MNEISLKWLFFVEPWSIIERKRYLSIFWRSLANLKSRVSFSRWIEVKESGLWNKKMNKFREIFVFVSHRLLLKDSFKNVIWFFFNFWMNAKRSTTENSENFNKKIRNSKTSHLDRPTWQTTLGRKGDQPIYIFLFI